MTSEQERIRSIISCADGQAFPTIAQHLAFETDVAADTALSLMAAVRRDIAAAAPPASINDTWSAAVSDTNRSVSTSPYAFGLPEPNRADSNERAKSSWGAAVKAANAGLS